ncbi:hypothetical protein G6F35_012441 [Rhizopus arrhizus]|nr:hypothetical protein G6F35_012441 [Rhizopus arrhizus]
MTVQHRQQHGQAVLLQANGDTARIRQRRGIDQRLHLHQQRPGALAGDHHAAAWLVGTAPGQEDRRRIGDLLQALVAHREHAQLVDRAEAVLERAQQAEAAAALTLEVQHRIDHVLQHARASDAAFLGHVADQKHGGAGLLGEAHQPCRALAHLADRAGRGGQALGPQGLHRIGHDQPRAGPGRMLQDRFNPGLGQRIDAVQRQLQPMRTAGHLGQRLLAGDIQHRQLRRHLRHRLQQQGRLADARIATHQHHRTFDQAAAQHAVELADAGGDPAVLGLLDILQGGDLRRVDLAGPAGPARGRRLGRRRALQHDLRQRT